MKRCTVCNKEVLLSEFREDSRGFLGTKSQCRRCERNYRINRNGFPFRGVGLEKVNLKTCKKCRHTKDTMFFGKDTQKKGGLSSYCKGCRSSKIKRRNSKEFKFRSVSLLKGGVKKCYSCKEYLELNMFRKSRRSADGHDGKCKACCKKYETSEKRKRAVAHRIQNDDIYRLRKHMKSRLYSALRSKKSKKNAKTIDVIGCTWVELIEHLNNNPYGFKVCDSDIDIDHIIPLSSAECAEDIYRLSHYSNLQLLPSEYNRHIKIDNEWSVCDFERWLINNQKVKYE